MRNRACLPRTPANAPVRAFRSVMLASAAMAAGTLTQGCSTDTSGPDKRLGVSSSPRVAAANRPIPKGGGTYKLGKPYMIAGRWYTPRDEPGYDRTGIASWYGDDFHGRKTANGEIYDMNALTAAHPTLPMPSYAYVTNLQNGRTILVRINDRGPYVGDRIIDLSRASARALGTAGQGLGKVRVRYAGRAPLNGDDSHERRYLAAQPWSAGPAVAGAQPAPYTAAAVRAPAPRRDGASWSVMSHRSGLGAAPR